MSVANGVFGRGMAGAGDLNGDGIDDLLMAQQADSPGSDGMVVVIGGATGGLIARINAPDPGGAGNRAGFGSFWISKVGSRAIGTSDLASCSGGAVGALCPQNPVGPPDSIPEIVVGARGVDANGTDTGRVYVYVPAGAAAEHPDDHRGGPRLRDERQLQDGIGDRAAEPSRRPDAVEERQLRRRQRGRGEPGGRRGRAGQRDADRRRGVHTL